MPIIRTKKGYKWGTTGKVYPTKKEAIRQARAIEASKNKRRKK